MPIPPSMQASLDPMVEVPTAFSWSGAFQSSATILMHRCSIWAVWGYSSRSTMFLSRAVPMSLLASSSIQVVTKVARFSMEYPSSLSSSWMIW